jgi:transposase
MKWLYVGSDVAKATVEAAVWGVAEWHGVGLGEWGNEAAGYEWLKEAVEQERQRRGADGVQLVVEPTGGYELGLVAFAREQGWLVSLPNPKVVRDYGKSIGQRAKTDRQDALLLAAMGPNGSQRYKWRCQRRLSNWRVCCNAKKNWPSCCKPSVTGWTTCAIGPGWCQRW